MREGDCLGPSIRTEFPVNTVDMGFDRAHCNNQDIGDFDDSSL